MAAPVGMEAVLPGGGSGGMVCTRRSGGENSVRPGAAARGIGREDELTYYDQPLPDGRGSVEHDPSGSGCFGPWKKSRWWISATGLRRRPIRRGGVPIEAAPSGHADA